MAKKSKSISFSNATIDLEMRTIEELKKDSVVVTSLDEVLNEWNGLPGLSIMIKQDVQCGSSESEIAN